MEHDDPRTLARLLLFGSPNTRRTLGERLLVNGGPDCWSMLVSTVRSRESATLRGRCLEVLGHAIAAADRRTAEALLDALFTPSEPPALPQTSTRVSEPV